MVHLGVYAGCSAAAVFLKEKTTLKSVIKQEAQGQHHSPESYRPIFLYVNTYKNSSPNCDSTYPWRSWHYMKLISAFEQETSMQI
jgi:hypothetical protein